MKKCPYCGTNIPYSDNYCYLCQRTFEIPKPEEDGPHTLDLSQEEWRKPWAAAGLSLVGIGLGQFYNGETAKGLLFLALVLGSPFLLPLVTTLSPLMVMLVLWGAAVADAWLSAAKINRLQKAFRKKSILFWPETGILVIGAVIILAMAYVPHTAAQSVSMAAGAVADTNYPGYAVPLYDTAVALSPNDTGIRMSRVKVMHALGRDRDAIAELGNLIAAEPDEPAPLVMTGNLLYENGEYEASARYFEKALAINRKDAWTWVRKGDANLAIAVVEMQKMRNKYRTLTSASTGLSGAGGNATEQELNAFESTQSYRDAMACYNEAMKIDPMVSVEVSAHILAATQSLVEMYQGILTDMGQANATSGSC